MRILHIPDDSAQPAQAQAATPAPAPVTLPAPAPAGVEVERVDALENVAKSILEKIQSIEERLKGLESSKSEVLSPEPEIQKPKPATKDLGHRTSDPVTMDSAALKKNLMEKMWKHLNDQAAA